jgi:hypothetical protein
MQWVNKCNDNNVCISGGIIQQKARKYAEQLNIQGQLEFSRGWLYLFQKRNNLKSYKLHGEASSINPIDVINGRKMLLHETRMYEKHDIYNMDETAVLYNFQPRTSIANAPKAGVKKDKSRITAALAANADGSDKLTIFLLARLAARDALAI